MIKSLLTIVSIFSATLVSTPSFSASTAWKNLGGGKARMIATKDPQTDKISGLVEVKLDYGWKTYWRSPGGSGIPPEFDFSRSQKVTSHSVRYPVPQWISLPDAEFYGYKEKVSFVFTADAMDIDASLELDLHIGVCEEICIPATAQFSLSSDQLNTSDAKSDTAIAIGQSTLPALASEKLSVTEITINGRRVSGILRAGNSEGPIDVVLELADIWTSDPASAKRDAEGIWQFETKLPKSLLGKNFDNSDWQYSIIQRLENGGKVAIAVDGKLAKAGN